MSANTMMACIHRPRSNPGSRPTDVRSGWVSDGEIDSRPGVIGDRCEQQLDRLPVQNPNHYVPGSTLRALTCVLYVGSRFPSFHAILQVSGISSAVVFPSSRSLSTPLVAH